MVTERVVSEAQNGRSVLVICKNIKEVEELEKYI